MQKEVFAVNEANFSEIAERIRDALAVRKVGEREIGRAALLFEELFFRARSMGVEEMRVTLQSRLGDLSMHLFLAGRNAILSRTSPSLPRTTWKPTAH